MIVAWPLPTGWTQPSASTFATLFVAAAEGRVCREIDIIPALRAAADEHGMRALEIGQGHGGGRDFEVRR